VIAVLSMTAKWNCSIDAEKWIRSVCLDVAYITYSENTSNNDNNNRVRLKLSLMPFRSNLVLWSVHRRRFVYNCLFDDVSSFSALCTRAHRGDRLLLSTPVICSLIFSGLLIPCRPYHHPRLHTSSQWDSWFLAPTSGWCHWRHWQTHLDVNWGTTWNHLGLPIPAHFICDTTGNAVSFMSTLTMIRSHSVHITCNVIF